MSSMPTIFFWGGGGVVGGHCPNSHPHNPTSCEWGSHMYQIHGILFPTIYATRRRQWEELARHSQGNVPWCFG